VASLTDERDHTAVDIPSWEGKHQIVGGLDAGFG
jgi:hypothetical protein